MIGRATLWLTVIAAAVCLYHWAGLDRSHVVLYLVSIPAWILPFFTDIQAVNRYVLYALTIACWFAVGLGIDALFARAKRRSR